MHGTGTRELKCPVPSIKCTVPRYQKKKANMHGNSTRKLKCTVPRYQYRKANMHNTSIGKLKCTVPVRESSNARYRTARMHGTRTGNLKRTIQDSSQTRYRTAPGAAEGWRRQRVLHQVLELLEIHAAGNEYWNG